MLLGDELIDVTTNAIKEKASGIQNIEYKNLIIYEKGDPWYNGNILNIPIKFIIGGIALVSIMKTK